MVNILGSPLSPRFDLSGASTSSGLLVGPPIALAFLDKFLLNKRVEIWIEPIVMDLFFLVIFELVFDRKPVGGYYRRDKWCLRWRSADGIRSPS